MEAYFDNNATTRMDERVLETMLPFFKDVFANPSSMHRKGQEANVHMEKSREKICEILGIEPLELVFTASGTESNNLAIRGAVKAYKKRKSYNNFKNRTSSSTYNN